MNFLRHTTKRLSDYLFFGNLFVALCAVCLTAATYLLVHRKMPSAVAALVFTATTFLYNFDSLLPHKLQQQAVFSERRAWVQWQHNYILGLVVLAGLAATILFVRLQLWNYLLFTGHLFLLSVCYSLPVLPAAAGWRPLRDIPLLKIFLIAYVWSCVTVWLPLLLLGLDILSQTSLLLFAQRFLFLLPLTIVFDIRDIARDKNTATLTLPGLIGVANAKYIAGATLLLYLFLVLLKPVGEGQAALLISGIISGVFIWQTDETRNEYFYALAIDGMMLLPFLLLLIL